VQEETALEDKQAELFGLTVPSQSWREEIAEAENSWLSPKALQHCVSIYLSVAADTPGSFLLGDKPLRTLRLSQEIRAKLLKDFFQLARSTDPVARRWEKWLKGADPLLRVTFDQETAAAEPKVAYLDVLHPLVRQSARYMQRSDAVRVALTVSSESFPPGRYAFALYRWRKVGVRADDALVAIASDPGLDNAVMSLLEAAADSPDDRLPDPAAISRIEDRHHERWHTARANHMVENRGLVQHREQSLTTSHRARCKLLEDQIANATNERIRRMKEGEMARAAYSYERRTAELQKQVDNADIHATLVVEGTLEVTQEGAP